MKTRIILAIVLMTTFFVGCKNEKSVDSLEVVTPETIVDKTFKVTLNVILKKDDTFSLFYTEDGTTDFSKTAPIWKAVKGSDAEQSVVYNLPEEVFPSQLRLDFGLAKVQDDITLKSVILEYKGKKREIVGPELASFFQADLNKCTFDASTGIIKAVIKDGVRQFPSLYPQEKMLKPEMEKLAQ